MTLPRFCLLALMMACSMPALAQDRAPAGRIEEIVIAAPPGRGSEFDRKRRSFLRSNSIQTGINLSRQDRP
jgi:hypothetical protein